MEAPLRVGDIPGTRVLMLALGYCLGALAQAGLGLYFFSRDFALPMGPLRRLSFESFTASVIGGAAAYGALAYLGSRLDLDTVAGIVSQGAIAGTIGLIIIAVTLALLKNNELVEAYGSLRRRYVKEPPAVEATDVA